MHQDGEVEAPADASRPMISTSSEHHPGEAMDRLHQNEFVLMRTDDGSNQTSLGKVVIENEKTWIRPLTRRAREDVWGIRPRNKEQAFALDALLNDDVHLVTLLGKAGTGKTLLAMACLLYTSPSPRDKRQSRMPSSA